MPIDGFDCVDTSISLAQPFLEYFKYIVPFYFCLNFGCHYHSSVVNSRDVTHFRPPRITHTSKLFGIGICSLYFASDDLIKRGLVTRFVEVLTYLT